MKDDLEKRAHELTEEFMKSDEILDFQSYMVFLQKKGLFTKNGEVEIAIVDDKGIERTFKLTGYKND